MIGILVFATVSSCVLGFADGESNPYIEAMNKTPWKSVQKYVEVRPGAFLFYWLYYADGTAAGADRKPLIIWIQGGPGLAASGLANFAEIGPLDMDMNPRNHTWVKRRNLLLIDHPVGTGFSYVTNNTLYVKSDRELALDLHKAIKTFFRRHKQFRKTPTYIFGQSYGGKITPRLAYYLHRAIKNKRLQMNFKGIGIGGGWVDPKESTLIQPQFLYNMGVLSQTEYARSMELARKMCLQMDKKEYVLAGDTETIMFNIFQNNGLDINFNNINELSPYPALDRLQIKVNKYVKPALSHIVNQSLHWEYRSEEVWQNLNPSLLVPSMKFLEILLNKTKLKVAVYNGNLDVITPLAGASNWVHKLRWPGAEEFRETKKLSIRGTRNGFYKEAGQLTFWGVFRAGHWVPEENPEAMEQILEHIMLDDDSTRWSQWGAGRNISLFTND